MVKILSDVSLSTSADDLTVGGTIELGHATDTTLSRSAAGTLAVEGVAVALTSQIPPTGSVVMWMTGTAPSGWLFLDGSTISYSAYPALAAVFGVSSGTFALPDMRDRFVGGRAATVDGWANNAGTFAPNTGNIHSHTTNIAHAHADTIAVSTHGDHTHSVDVASTTSSAPTGSTSVVLFTGSGTSQGVASTSHTHTTNPAAVTSGAESTNLTHTVTGGVTSLGTTSVTSSDGTISPKATLLNFIIKT
jgi:microcystin-dependent protein